MVRHLLAVVLSLLVVTESSLGPASRLDVQGSDPVRLQHTRWFSSQPVSGMGFRLRLTLAGSLWFGVKRSRQPGRPAR